MKFCIKCGKTAGDNEAFCSSCGTRFDAILQPAHEQLPQTPNVAYINNPPKKNHKGLIIALISVLSLLLIAGIGVGGFFYYTRQKTDAFKKYVASYRAKADTYESLGDMEPYYEQFLEEANQLIAKKDYKRMVEQKQKMNTLWPQVEKMIEKIDDQKEQCDQIAEEMEDSGKYFFGDMEETYLDAKNEAEKAIEAYHAKEAEKKIKVLVETAEEIKEYDRLEVENYRKDIRQVTLGSGWMELESSLLESRKKEVDNSLDSGNYAETKQAYDAFMKQKESLEAVKNAGHVLSGYNQADVSVDHEVKLYFDIAEITDWNNDGFTIYEKAQNENDWKSCKLLNVNEVEGNMTIDLVADVSDRMQDSFSTMQNSLSTFAASTSADTFLGLSLIGNVYERKLNFTQDKTSICNGINQLTCYGLTSLYQSLYSSVMYTATAKGAKCVVAFTDGKNVSYNTGFDYTEDDVIRVAKTYQIPIYIIGLGFNPDSYLLRRIASETGGQYYDRISVYDMASIYNTIYTQQKNRYEVTYQSEFESNCDRQIYMLYYDTHSNVGIRFENSLAASTLYNGYQMTFDGSNLTGYYTDQKNLSSDDLSHIANINDLQKVINIYCAKNGYHFQNADVLQEMTSLGVISSNGTLDMDATTNQMKQNSTVWANYMALYNHRYEVVYQEVYKVYTQHGRNISLEQLMPLVHQNLGQTDQTRFSLDVTAAYKAITS